MSVIDKLKGFFIEEEEEEPIKSEVIQVEIPAPEVKEEIVEEEDTIADTQAIKIEEKTPVFFNDDDFKELEKPKEIKSSYIKEKPVIKKEEKKVFRPTPIISPVYGVLDKNYHKEDISERKIPTSSVYNTASLSLDEVRKKAYGSLEDDLEDTLFGSKSILFKKEPEVPAVKVEDELLDDLTDVIDFDDDHINVEDINIEPKEDKLKSDDLFDLIDSMYEKGE